MATNPFGQNNMDSMDKEKNQLSQVIWDYMKREDKLHKVTTCKHPTWQNSSFTYNFPQFWHVG